MFLIILIIYIHYFFLSFLRFKHPSPLCLNLSNIKYLSLDLSSYFYPINVFLARSLYTSFLSIF